MGIGSSKQTSKERSKKASKKNYNNHGLFHKELEYVVDMLHSYNQAYIPLILIQAHSTEPEGMIEIEKGIVMLHYCKKDCILRTKKLKSNTLDRSISMEYACLKQLRIYDRYENESPKYNFFIDEANKEEGGIYICLDHEIKKLFTFEPGQIYPVGRMVELIKEKIKMEKIHIGVISCRSRDPCSEVIVALPGSPSNYANKLNQDKIHKAFIRKENSAEKENRKGMHPALSLYTRKRKRRSR